MALLPTLGTRILEELDVERISLELQSRSVNYQRPSVLPSLPAPASFSGENLLAPMSNVIIDNPLQSHEQPTLDVGSPAPSNTALSINGEDVAVDPMAQSATSWVTASEAASLPVMVEAGSTKPGPSSGPDPLSESITSAVVCPSTLPCNSVTDPPSRQVLPTRSTTSQSDHSSALAPTSNSAPTDAHSTSDSFHPPYPLTQKSKAELWADLKIQTFTRTLTVIYAITFLSLQTHVQLNMLGRAKYVQSVRALEREERAEEGVGLVELLFFGGWTQLDNDEEAREGNGGWEEVDEDVERKYLTVSWWLLHIGWRELAERVRLAVEEVFNGSVFCYLPFGRRLELTRFGRVSLKTRLGIDDLRMLINQVRLKVEETKEGSEGPCAECVSRYPVPFPSAKLRACSFGPILLPPSNSPEEQNVLIQGGISPHLAEVDPPLRRLLDEMRGYVSSAEFSLVLGKGVERGVEVLLDSIVCSLLLRRYAGSQC